MSIRTFDEPFRVNESRSALNNVPKPLCFELTSHALSSEHASTSDKANVDYLASLPESCDILDVKMTNNHLSAL